MICHATGFCGRTYEALGEALTSGHRVFAVDLRGHGHSPTTANGDFSWRSIVDDVAVAIDAIGGPVHLFGHSMGGAVALQAEADRPGLLTSAFVYESMVVPPGIELPGAAENYLAVGSRRRREVFASRAEAIWRYASRPPLSVLSARSLASYVEHGFEDLEDGTVRLRCRGESEALVFEATGSVTTESLAGVRVPTVVATGDPSQSDLASITRRAAEVVPGARLLVCEGLGHFGPLEGPASVATEILAFTSRIDGDNRPSG